MSIEFAVGKRVVSLKDFKRYRAEERAPYFGEVLTIREIKHGCNCPGVTGVYFCFEEFQNTEHQCRCGMVREAAFWSKRFRPVRETSIDCFTALLAKPSVRLREDA